MKKFIPILLLAVWLQGCSSPAETPSNGAQPTPEQPPAAEQPAPTPQPPQTGNAQPAAPAEPSAEKPGDPASVYGNEIFQEVTVKKEKEDTYSVKGKARVFEAVFQYVVEDGHNELAQGVVNTSAGAPEWGHFEFTVQVKKDQPNSTLTLVLFEVSAKDGSRRLELPIPLPE
ncbi:Gmad2 immunoglobulin-like domain-containing protein [Brevibacillus composti]|uniref:Gmad2 immunoglobulin-like domain-containing protein n=2 Tax=Brevibacillus composti TaxID=2796470 RepID=A0A7T5EIA8_9BACL|nr:Gmad2 immunoglobulin-like domain-containing protein [Brevibacillus composti]QQE73144.1 Gmad2 immunoglobulin-like domain-containing protein [Brevibacillus composti]QUO40222.1 Gmad2 immunoglobulin-like domain-containing protein [Brevibacillus composti]